MKKLLPISFLLTGCASPVHVSRWNPLRLLPFVSASPTTAGESTISAAGPDYNWMWQVSAIGVVLFAIATSWIAKRITKRAMLLAGSGLVISWWGASMKIIQKHMNWAIPYIVGAFLLWGTVELGLNIYERFKKNGAQDANQ